MIRQLHEHERGVSTVVTHVLAIGITSLLVISLLLATGSYLEDQRELVAKSELDTVGNRLANELSQVDRLNTRGGSVTLTSEHTSKVAGQSYDVVIERGPACDSPAVETDTCLVLTVESMDIRRVVALKNETNVRLDRIKPGEFRLGSAGGGTSTSVRDAGTVNLPANIGVGRSVAAGGSGRVVDIANDPPFPRFRFSPGAPHSGSPVIFNASGSRDIDGTIDRYYWNFASDDPGSTWQATTDSQFTHDYAGEPGRYNVSLAVEDNDGAVSNQTQTVTIAGLEYNGDMTMAASDGVGFTVTNNWSSYDTEVESLLIDPPDYIDEFDNNGEIQIGANTYDVSNRDIPDGGIIVPISGGYNVPSGSTIGVQVRGFESSPAGQPVRIAVRHEVDGQTNSTVFTDVPAGVDITDYRLEASGQDVDLVFNASEELDQIEVNLKGDADDDYGGTMGDIDLVRSSFTEQYLSGPDTYEYTADVSTGQNGNFIADLTYVESTGGRESGDVATPTTQASVVVSSSSGYLWTESYHWDAAVAEDGLVHENFGDHDRDRLELGYSATTTGLLTYYPFDESGGDTALDVSGNGHDGEFEGPNDPKTDRTGVVGSGYEFYESGGEYVLDDDAENYLNGQGAVTISAWVKSEKIDTNRGVMIGEDPTGSDNTVGFRYDSQGASSGCDECLKAGFSINSKANERQYESGGGTQTNDWQHVVVTWSDNEQVKMYLDGSRDTDNLVDFTTGSGDIAGVEKLIIGKGGKDVGGNWDGNIDEVRIYDRELSAAEVQDLYDAPSEGSMTTDWQPGTTISYDDLELNYGVDLGSGDDVEVTVESDTDGDGTPDHTSDPVDLPDGSGTEAVSGLPSGESSDRYRLVVDIEAGDVTNDPSVDSLELQEDS